MLSEKFWQRVDKTDTCWLWTGHVRDSGYALSSVGGQPKYVHRLAYEALVGPIPKGLHIDHLCRVRNCVNPDHLEPVTQTENNRRAALYRPKLKFCLRGHERNEANVAASGNCRECARENWAKRHPPKPLATHCGRGHEFTPENEYRPPSGGRQCKACKNARARKAWRSRQPKEAPAHLSATTEETA